MTTDLDYTSAGGTFGSPGSHGLVLIYMEKMSNQRMPTGSPNENQNELYYPSGQPTMLPSGRPTGVPTGVTTGFPTMHSDSTTTMHSNISELHLSVAVSDCQDCEMFWVRRLNEQYQVPVEAILDTVASRLDELQYLGHQACKFEAAVGAAQDSTFVGGCDGHLFFIRVPSSLLIEVIVAEQESVFYRWEVDVRGAYDRLRRSTEVLTGSGLDSNTSPWVLSWVVDHAPSGAHPGMEVSVYRLSLNEAQ
jgi:hypothetical protein